MSGKELRTPARINSWAVINFDPDLNLLSIQKFVRGLEIAMVSLGELSDIQN